MSAPSPRSRGRGCVYLGLFVVIGLPTLTLLAIVGFFVFRESTAREELQQRITDRRSEGLPVDDASMRVYYEQATSSEHTQEWLLLLEELTGDRFKESATDIPILGTNEEIPRPGHPWDKEAATRQFLAEWNDLYQRTVTLAGKSEAVRFPIVFNSVGTLLPETQNMRQAARLLQLRGQLAIYDRDAEEARRSITALFDLEETLHGQPFLVSHLVRIAINGMGLNLLKRALEYDVLTEKELEQLLPEVLARTSVGSDWREALNAEVGMALPVYQNPAQLGTPGLSGSKLPFRSRDAILYLDLIEGASELPTEDLDRFHADLKEFEAELEAVFNNSGLLERFDSLMTGMMTPALSAAGEAFIRSAVMHRLAALAIGVRLYEKEHGAFPESLNALEAYKLSAADLRPLGGEPFGYQIKEGDAYLWGFDFHSGETEVSDTLPIIDPESPNAELRQLWLWRIRDASLAD